MYAGGDASENGDEIDYIMYDSSSRVVVYCRNVMLGRQFRVMLVAFFPSAFVALSFLVKIIIIIV